MARFFGLQDRFGALDDAEAVAEITRRYTPILAENTHLLLKRNTDSPAPLSFVGAGEVHSRLGQPVKVPTVEGARLWCRTRIRYSILGQLRSFVCKPAPVYIQLESISGRVMTSRFLACAGESGFSLKPMIYDTNSLLAFYFPNQAAGVFHPYQISFMVRPDDAKYFEPEILIGFESTDSL
jgi:hypothetical protein